MARTKSSTTPMPAISSVRASLGRMQTQGERVVSRLRRDAETFMARSRGEIMKEVRQVERRVLKALHAATAEQVAGLERRIAKVEQTVAELRGSTEEKAA